MTPRRQDHVRDVRNALTDPWRIVAGLGLEKGSQRQATGVLVCCPVHGDRTPSCSVTRGPDGTARVRCFGCDFSGDALTLIATVRGLSLRSADDFRMVLAEGARIAGHLTLEAEILDGVARADRPAVPPPAPEPEVPYPDEAEVAALWRACRRVTDDRDASRCLVERLLDPELVATRSLARVIPDGAKLPEWAVYGARTWAETGHRLLVRAFDAAGEFRSVRAWRVVDGKPKRLPPRGRKAAGLVLANRAAFGMLRGGRPARVLIAEGEPDWITLACREPDGVAVLGIMSGSWSADFADLVPTGADVTICTDADEQGERYAHAIAESLGERCRTWRAA